MLYEIQEGSIPEVAKDYKQNNVLWLVIADVSNVSQPDRLFH